MRNSQDSWSEDRQWHQIQKRMIDCLCKNKKGHRHRLNCKMQSIMQYNKLENFRPQG